MMDTKSPAFPFEFPVGRTFGDIYYGLTKREWLLGQVLHGALREFTRENGIGRVNPEVDALTVARKAILITNAVIQQLQDEERDDNDKLFDDCLKEKRPEKPTS